MTPSAAPTKEEIEAVREAMREVTVNWALLDMLRERTHNAHKQAIKLFTDWLRKNPDMRRDAASIRDLREKTNSLEYSLINTFRIYFESRKGAKVVGKKTAEPPSASTQFPWSKSAVGQKLMQSDAEIEEKDYLDEALEALEHTNSQITERETRQ